MVTGSNTVTDLRGSATLLSDKNFDIEVAGVHSRDIPTEIEWQQGQPEAVSIPLALEASGFAPGDTHFFTISARNSSEELHGELSISLLNGKPDQVSLFPNLMFTIRLNNEVIAGPSLGSDISALTNIPLGHVPSGEKVHPEVEVHFPESAGNDLQGLGAWVQVRVEGFNK